MRTDAILIASLSLIASTLAAKDLSGPIAPQLSLEQSVGLQVQPSTINVLESPVSKVIAPAVRPESSEAARGVATSAPKPLSLGTIDAEVENESTLVTIRLSEVPRWKEAMLEEHGTFLQIKLPGVIVANSGEFLDGNGPYLRKIASFQVNSVDGAVRLFVAQDAAKVKLAASVEVLGDRLVVTIDHKKLEQLIGSQTTAEEVMKQTKVDESIPAPSEIIKAKGESPDQKVGLGSAIPDMQDKLVGVAVFSLIMFAIFLGLQRFKKRGSMPKGKLGSVEDDLTPAKMRLLSSMPVAPKQKLLLVQVGAQQILLGVSADSVNYLTSIQSNPSSDRSFAGHLSAPSSEATVKLKSTADLTTAPRTRNAPPAPASVSRPVRPRIQVEVGDEAPPVKTRESSRSDDLTKQIRERLKGLAST